MTAAMYPVNSFTATGHFQPRPLDTLNQPEQVRRSLKINDLIEDPTMPSLGPNGPSYGPVAVPNPRPPNPKPKPKPQPAPAPAHSLNQHSYGANQRLLYPEYTFHGNPAPFPLYVRNKNGNAHLAADGPEAEEAIRAVVAREFQLPTTGCVHVELQMTPVDMDDQGRWYHGYGRLARALGGFGNAGRGHSGITAPMLVVWLPEQRVPSYKARALCALNGPSPEELAYHAAADRVVAALRSGAWLDGNWSPGAAAWRTKIHDCAFEFRDGLTDLAHVVAPGTFVALPLPNQDGTVDVFRCIAQDGSREAKERLRSWAADRGVQLDL